MGLFGKQKKFDKTEPEMIVAVSRDADKEAGQTLEFGHYPYYYKGDNSPIVWRILKKEDGCFLVISENALDCRPFHGAVGLCNWTSCDLRNWLNGEFLETAFSPEEKEMIRLHPNTKDKVFLLDKYEIVHNLDEMYQKVCESTLYATAQGVLSEKKSQFFRFASKSETCCRWWTRSNAEIVDFDGKFSILPGNSEGIGVRPALWLKYASIMVKPVVIAKPAPPKRKSERDVWKKKNVGDELLFGSYYIGTMVKAPIVWQVLAKENDRLLIVSKFALDYKTYHNIETDITWERCGLRKWLNGEFLYSAFDEAELAVIPAVTVKAENNPKFRRISPGNSTVDRVFLLSVTEVQKYFDSVKARKCVPTAFAIEQGIWTYKDVTLDGKPTCSWWLRSPGSVSSKAGTIEREGTFSSEGLAIGNKNAVRPALWINLNS